MVDRDDLTMVLDIGKSHAKLVLVDGDGEVRARQAQANCSADGPGYQALGIDALHAWLADAIPTMPGVEAVRRISITTHGAAFCGIGKGRLAIPPIDYEWDGYGDARDPYAAEIDAFEENGTPQLPLGLNAGLQLHWLQAQRPELWARAEQWLPYPQYWAWWFSGTACSEVSSLGCHTGLWSPKDANFSPWARKTGIAAGFAPLRKAWESLGNVRPDRAAMLGLGHDVKVHVGSHDSNACLARYLHRGPLQAMVLSTGTWCVLMAPGSPLQAWEPGRDALVNVAVDGRPVPTERFMGGRDFARLSTGVDASAATHHALWELLARGWTALPGRPDAILRDGHMVQGGIEAVPMHLRPALASLYCADTAARMVNRFDPTCERPVVVDGPLAGNEAFRTALALLLSLREVKTSHDPLEGTARGAWMLSRWHQASSTPEMTRTHQVPLELRHAMASWQRRRGENMESAPSQPVPSSPRCVATRIE
jgi:L-fuculokinase